MRPLIDFGPRHHTNTRPKSLEPVEHEVQALKKLPKSGP
jgi:hypothetical protein